MTGDALEIKIAHLQMIQGVIGRMASDTQTLKTLAITVAAAIVALAQGGGAITTWLALLGIVPTLLFWWLTAHALRIERAYRALYDAVRKDEPVEPFAMEWRPYQKKVDNPLKLAFSGSVLLPYLGVIMILIVVAVIAWGGASVTEGKSPDGQLAIEQTK